MRVLLLNPPGPNGQGFIREGRCHQRLSSYVYCMIPISLPSIAGLLRERGHDVRIIDAVGPRVKPGELSAEVRHFNPGLVIVSISTPTYESDVEIIEQLADWTPAHLSAIGVHVTAMAGGTLLESRLQSVIRGEPAEWTSADLADCLAQRKDLSSAPGLSFKRGGEILHNADRGFDGNLEELPPPARDLLPEEDYFLPILNRPYTLVQPTRGCPHHCTYCTAPIYDGIKLRRRTPSKVVDEIESIRTVAYAKEIDPDWAQFYCATPLPGTPMREELQQEGRLPQGPWSSLEFQKPHSVSADLTPEELRFERARAYAEFYLRPSVARRMLKRIRPSEIGLFAAHTTTFVRSWVLSA